MLLSIFNTIVTEETTAIYIYIENRKRVKFIYLGELTHVLSLAATLSAAH